jgi:hypothetical protein
MATMKFTDETLRRMTVQAKKVATRKIHILQKSDLATSLPTSKGDLEVLHQRFAAKELWEAMVPSNEVKRYLPKSGSLMSFEKKQPIGCLDIK